MLLKIYPSNPNERHIQMVVDHLRKGGVIIFPTDTIYALGCDITQFKAVEQICKVKGVELEKANFSFICYDLSHISDYAKQIDNDTFRLMKKALPGPFTFILSASSNVPSRYFGPKTKKKTIGIRIPDNEIARLLVKELGNPLMSTSIHDDDEVIEYITDPELIHEKYAEKVDIVIDGGYGDNQPSTVIDCTEGEPIILRQGKGII